MTDDDCVITFVKLPDIEIIFVKPPPPPPQTDEEPEQEPVEPEPDVVRFTAHPSINEIQCAGGKGFDAIVALVQRFYDVPSHGVHMSRKRACCAMLKVVHPDRGGRHGIPKETCTSLAQFITPFLTG